jgi:hypothetical protein
MFGNQNTNTATNNSNNPANGNPAGNQQQNTNTVATGNDNPAAGGQQEKPANPLDFYAGIFDTSKDGEKKTAPKFALPKDKLAEAAKNIDFMSGIDPALMEKAKTGDVGSIMTMMSEIARNSYINSLDHTSSLSDNFINQRLSFENEGFNGKVKSQLTNEALGSSTANFNNPVVKAQMTEFAQRLAEKNPDASPAEIAAKTKDYFIQLAKAVSGDEGSGDNSANKGNPNQPSGADVNWEDYLFNK